MLVFTIALVILWVGEVSGIPSGRHKQLYVTTLDNAFSYSCPLGEAIGYLESIHYNHEEDRIWIIDCTKKLPQNGTSSWTGFVNNYDGTMQFECGAQSVISGMASVHSNHHEDRRYRFRCTYISSHRKTNCSWAHSVNLYDGKFDYHAPRSYYLTGMYSSHSNYYEDRYFQLKICRLQMK